MPSAISTPAIWYWMMSRPVQGPAKKAQDERSERPAGASACGNARGSTPSLRSTSTATLTTVKTQSSSSAVVPPSAGTSPTKPIRAKASSVVKPIAT
jgi:hypothetical protein